MAGPETEKRFGDHRKHMRKIQICIQHLLLIFFEYLVMVDTNICLTEKRLGTMTHYLDDLKTVAPSPTVPAFPWAGEEQHT